MYLQCVYRNIGTLVLTDPRVSPCEYESVLHSPKSSITSETSLGMCNTSPPSGQAGPIAYWGTSEPIGVMSDAQQAEADAQQAEADALRWGHSIVFTQFMRRINGAQFDIEQRRQHARSLEAIMRRDLRFFRFVESVLIQMSRVPGANDFGGAEGVEVLQLMLASARDWPLGPGAYAVVARQMARAEYVRVFGSL